MQDIKLTKEQRLRAWEDNAAIYLWMQQNQKWFQVVSGGTFAFSVFSLIALKLTSLPLPLVYGFSGVVGLLVAFKVEEGLAEFSETTFRAFSKKAVNSTEKTLKWMKLVPTVVLSLITSVGSLLIAPVLGEAITENGGDQLSEQITENNKAILSSINAISETEKGKSKELSEDKKQVIAYYDDLIDKAEKEAERRAESFKRNYAELMNEPWYVTRYNSFKKG